MDGRRNNGEWKIENGKCPDNFQFSIIHYQFIMSDRCVFVPYPSDFNTYGWADVVIPQEAKSLEVCRAARRFVRLPGPHKVFLQSRNDQRFEIFKRYLEKQYHFKEDHRHGYSVRTQDNK
jgi:hypothetical protein